MPPQVCGSDSSPGRAAFDNRDRPLSCYFDAYGAAAGAANLHQLGLDFDTYLLQAPFEPVRYLSTSGSRTALMTVVLSLSYSLYSGTSSEEIER